MRFNEVKSFLIGVAKPRGEATPTHSKTLDSTKVKSFPIGVAKPRGEATPTHSKTLQFDAIAIRRAAKKGLNVATHRRALERSRSSNPSRSEWQSHVAKPHQLTPKHCNSTPLKMMSDEKRAQRRHSPTSARTLEIL